MNAKAGSLQKLIGIAGKPLEFVYKKIPDSVQTGVNEALVRVLCQMRDGTSGVVSRRKIYDRIQARHGPLKGACGLLRVNIRVLDEVARELIKRSKTGSALEGAVSGAAGLPGLIVDIPALYGILFHLIQEVATVYGFPVKPPPRKGLYS